MWRTPINKKYNVEKLFMNVGHTVWHLPLYHVDLNPIELVWHDIKGRVGECFITFNEIDKTTVPQTLFWLFIQKMKKML